MLFISFATWVTMAMFNDLRINLMAQNLIWGWKYFQEWCHVCTKGVRKGGLGLTPSLSLIFYENFITCAKEINCFRILFAR